MRVYKILALISFGLFFKAGSFAQTYATEELKIEAESHIQNKKQQLGISDDKNSDMQTVSKPENKLVNQPTEIPNFSNWHKISSITIANVDERHSSAEIAQFNDEASSEYEINDFYVDIDSKQFVKQNRSTKKVQFFSLIIEDSVIKFDCDCNIPQFVIVENSDSKLVLSQSSPDEESKFDFIFTFVK